jgi:hypothetical protein
MFSIGAVHKRRRKMGVGGVKNWSKLSTDNTKKLQIWGWGCQKLQKLPTLFMDAPYLLGDIFVFTCMHVLANWIELPPTPQNPSPIISPLQRSAKC